MIPEPATLALFAFLSLLTCFIGWRKRLFHFDSFPIAPVQITWFYVLFAFLIYFGVSNGITPILGTILKNHFLSRPSSTTLLSLSSWLNFINSGTIFLVLFIFFCFLPKQTKKDLWRFSTDDQKSYTKDFTFALFTWVISFPVVIFVNQGMDFLLMKFFHIQKLPEQLAVNFLKMTFGYPLYTLLTTITISIFAPLVEETLFRGFLQSFIRKHLGCRQAVFMTSVLFALFHYSPEQKLANLTIIASLFVFSLFLGIVYEKRKSLLAPIALHSTFNTVNVLNLYFLGGIPGGPI